MAQATPLPKKALSGAQVTAGSPPPRYSVYAPDCPTRMVLDRIADRWSGLVLGRLASEPMRFNRLRREVPGVSQKVLSQTMKRLERDGLVEREVFPTVPVTVEYSITPLGRTLHQAVKAIVDWAEGNIEAVLAAQAAYDARADRPLS
jgi:DNA-binding HxlR family transcriptional regulator